MGMSLKRAKRDKTRSEKDRIKRTQEAVTDLPDPERRKLTQEDVDTLRDAGLTEFAELAKRYVPSH